MIAATQTPLMSYHLADESDDGYGDLSAQYEPDETAVDKQLRATSESPINKIEPLPEASAFFVFTRDNQFVIVQQ